MRVFVSAVETFGDRGDTDAQAAGLDANDGKVAKCLAGDDGADRRLAGGTPAPAVHAVRVEYAVAGGQ